MELNNQNPTRIEIPPELKELVPAYLHRREGDVWSLRSFVGAKDFKSIKMLAHKLKGNGSSFGFDKISELGGLMMQASDSKDENEISRLIVELQNQINQIKSQNNF